MQLILKKRPKNPIIIEGFPGYGLVGTIATEFLIKHLDAKPIGSIRVEEIQPVIAVHHGEAVEPLGIYYATKTNIVLLHALTAVKGIEWELADILARMVKDLKVKEIISIEGIGSSMGDATSRAFYMGSNKKLKTIGIDALREGIIMGVTGALLLRKDLPMTCFFAETHSKLPDSRAAAKIIQVLDQYLGLDVDFKPLIEQAEKFELKLKALLEKARDATAPGGEKKVPYFG